LWLYNNYTYDAASIQARSAMVVPVPGTALSGSTVSFAWTAVTGAAAYWLDVGTTQGKGDIYAGNVGLVTALTVTGIPTDGSVIYVRLWTLMGNVWSYNDYTYTALRAVKAALISPTPATNLTASTVKFSWSAGQGATAYWLDVGTIQGQGNIFGANVGTNVSWTVSGIPPVGSVYVRLWSLIGGNWQVNDYTFQSANPNKASMISPTPGTTLSSSALFTWMAATGASAYWLDVGTVQGQGNIFAQNVGSATAMAVTGIPTSGGTIYVRLWTQLSGVWAYSDYVYAASTH